MIKKNIGACPICDRDMIDGPSIDEHHLVPKEYGGKNHPTILLHRVCHTKIHSTITNRELWHTYNTAQALRTHSEMKKFIKWIQRKDPEFNDVNYEANSKKLKRKRR